ncbi:hypothetical protein [Nitrosomonas communis]|uniref:Uncharacterized protein n=1 Tax=Nitrosomonas communis TaxID=44574 RepID=A0A1I4RKJ9_9PROT|nr:hypothetical protein [Nitrosomonas communis]SFM52788.1 hypothetical protein SAMN05421863_103341 [Nitrosomonas communis]
MNGYLKVLVVSYGLYISNAWAEDAPSFKNNILKIPRVDTSEQVGKYQNSEFKLAPDGRWDLLHANEAQRAIIDAIEIKILESFPMQVHVLVSGFLPTPCYHLGPINKRYADNQFEIAVNMTPPPPDTGCITVLEPFAITIPLDVYGLPKGCYQIYVNDKSGSFELSTDNQVEMQLLMESED